MENEPTRIELTHELKVKLLEAIKAGSLDLLMLPKPYENATDEEIARELIRCYKFDSKEYILKKADLLRRFATGELTTGQFEEDMFALMMQHWQ